LPRPPDRRSRNDKTVVFRQTESPLSHKLRGLRGAADRGRTGTLFRARDFKLLRRFGIHYTGVEFCDRKNMKGFI